MKKTFFLNFLFVSLFFTSSCKKEKAETPVETPVSNPTPDKSLGGIMYDKFWAKEAKFDQNNADIAKFNAAADFFRCKQCHGWDGLGNTGSYINRAPSKTRPNVTGLNLYQLVQSKTSDELYTAMKKTAGRRSISYDLSTYDPLTNATEGDKMPDYTQILTDAQIKDLVEFLKKGLSDVSQLYDGTYTGTYPTGKAIYTNIGKDGNAANGNAYFASKCSSCHGVDGKQILVENMTIGAFTRAKPYEVHHKVQYGQLGSTMLGQFSMTTAQMKDLYKALSDTTKYP